MGAPLALAKGTCDGAVFPVNGNGPKSTPSLYLSGVVCDVAGPLSLHVAQPLPEPGLGNPQSARPHRHMMALSTGEAGAEAGERR